MIRVLGAPQRLVDSVLTSRIRSEPLACEAVDNANIPFAVRTDIPTHDPADAQAFHGWKAGVYDSSGLVCQLSLMDRHWARVTVPFVSDEVRPGAYEYRAGEAVYAGMMFHHFGHFLLESTSRLWWPLRNGFKGEIVFQNTRLGQPLPDYAARFFDLLGVTDRIVLASRSFRFDRVYVPERSFVIKKHVHADFRLPFLAAGKVAEERSAPRLRERRSAGLYLSRARFPTRRSYGEKRLQRTFVEAGFTVAHLQELSLEEQIVLIRGHKRIAGIGGSAFHTVLFADTNKELVYICRDYDINPNFPMIDEIMKNQAVYIYNMPEHEATEVRTDRQIFAAYWNDVSLDIPKIEHCLRQSEILG